MGDSSCYPSFVRTLRAQNRLMLVCQSCLVGLIILSRQVGLPETTTNAATPILVIFPALYALMFYRIILPKHMVMTLQAYMVAKYPEIYSDSVKTGYVRSLCLNRIHHYYRPGMFYPLTWARVLHISLLEVEACYLALWATEKVIGDGDDVKAKKSRG